MSRTALSAIILATVAVAGCDLVPGTAENRAKSALSGYLIDPGSAKISVLKAEGQTVCGTVNAKNRMGAYVGATPFVIDGDYPSPVLWQEPTTSDYWTWSRDSASSAGHEAYDRLENGCAFKARWTKACGGDLAGALIYNEELCQAWRGKDWNKLRYLAEH